MSRIPFHDGRRFGVVGVAVDGEVEVAGLWARAVGIQSQEQGKRNRDTFEAWKKGVVPALSEDESHGWQSGEGRRRVERGVEPVGLDFEGNMGHDEGGVHGGEGGENEALVS